MIHDLSYEWWIKGGREMGKKRYATAQIIGQLREAEVASAAWARSVQ